MKHLNRLLMGIIAALLLTLQPVMLAAQTPDASPALSSTCLTEPIEEKESYLIGMSQANRGEPWRQAMNDQIEAAAAQHDHIEVVFADAAQDNAKQVADVEAFIQQGVDILIISPNEAAPLTDVVADACAQGIPVIVLDRKVNGDQYTMWIGADNEVIGEEAGAYTTEWCEENGHDPCLIGELRGLEGSTPAQERGDGFRTGLGDSNYEIVSSQNADWLRERALPVSQSMLQANPDINVIYAHNDPMGEAAIISADNLGIPMDEVLVIGIDGLPTPDGGIRSVMDGRLDVTFIYPTGGAEAIDWTVRILDGEQPQREVVLETEVVTPENAEEMLTKYGGD